MRRLKLKDPPATMSAADFRRAFEEQAPEAEVQRRMIDELVRRGWIVVRINSGGWKDGGGRWIPAYRIANFSEGESEGLSDLLALRGTGGPTCEALLIEAKRPKGGRVRGSQKRVIERFGLHGVTVHVLRSHDALEHLFSTIGG